MISSFHALLTTLPFLAEAAVHGGAEAGGHAAEAKHEVSAKAQQLFSDGHWASFLTNSIFVAGLVTIVFLWFFRSAMRKAQLVPGKKQNFVELLIEFLYGQVENIVGPKVAPGAFPLLATIFIYITIANWFGLVPGVGTIGFSGHETPGHFWSLSHIETPLLRPATADMNLTLGVAICAGVIWLYLSIRELGFFGLVHHTFGPKGGLEGMLKYALMPIFFIVGVIEVISMMFRPVTLSLRLYGNIFAGENLLHTMSGVVNTGSNAVNFIFSILIPLPFYFLEILVGVLQGMVFALLCAVFIKLTTTHEEGHGEEHAH